MRLAGKPFLVCAVLAVLGGFAFYFARSRKEEFGFRTVRPSRRDLIATVSATGTVFPIVEVLVGSQVSGRIEKIFVDFNDPVKKGTPLARIDPSTFQAKTDEAQAQIVHARASINDQKTTLRRIEKLYGDKIAPLADLESARTKLDLFQADLQQAVAAYNQARVDLTNTVIRAPMDGVVTSRNVEAGQTVAASLSAPTLFSIADDLSHLQVIANVDEADVGQVKENQPVNFTIDAFPGTVFSGKVQLIRNRPITVQGVVTFETVIYVNNPEEKLRPGMTANVSIIVAEKKQVLTIRNAALRFRPPDRFLEKASAAQEESDPGATTRNPGRKPLKKAKSHVTVWIVRANTPVPVKVRTGISDGISTEIREGLSENDQVIVASASPETAPAAGGNVFAPGTGRKLP
jgi:HlyD family secretion protein